MASTSTSLQVLNAAAEVAIHIWAPPDKQTYIVSDGCRSGKNNDIEAALASDGERDRRNSRKIAFPSFKHYEQPSRSTLEPIGRAIPSILSESLVARVRPARFTALDA